MKGSKNYRDRWRCTGAWEIAKIDEMGARRRNRVGRWPLWGGGVPNCHLLLPLLGTIGTGHLGIAKRI
jgi:hypothetical protein